MRHFFASKNFPFWLFTFSAIFILIISKLIQEGIFMDGMLYISVSKNLADGIGNFWEPHFSKTLMATFREQPPLYFALLASFYKFLGSSVYVERLFTFVCFSLTILYISKIWKSLFHNQPEIAKNSWLPILFFSVTPVVFWSYANHVEETVMTLFSTMSIFYLSEVLFKNEKIIINLILAGICIFLSSLTKGIQGLFPISGVFFYWVIKKDFSFKRNILYSSILIFTPFLIYGLLFIANNHSFEVMKLYLTNRLGYAFHSTVHNTTNNHFEIMIRLCTELIPAFGLMLILVLFHKKNNPYKSDKFLFKTETLWLLLIGFSGSLPLAITLEQRGWYLVTSLPLFVLAGAVIVANANNYLISNINIEKLSYKYLRAFTILLMCGSIIYTSFCIGKTKRDKEILNDVYILGKIIPRGEVIRIPLQMNEKWNFRTYMIRYNYISLDVLGIENNFFVIEKELSKDFVPINYQLYPIKTEYLDLYVLKKQ